MLTAHLSGPRIGERRAIGTCSCFSCLIAALRTATAMTVCLAAVETNFKSVMNREAGRTLPCSATIAKRLAAHEGLLHCVQASQFKVLASALTSIQTCTPCSTCRSSNTSNHTSDIDVDTAASEQCLNRVAGFGSAWNLWCAIGNGQCVDVTSCPRGCLRFMHRKIDAADVRRLHHATDHNPSPSLCAVHSQSLL